MVWRRQVISGFRSMTVLCLSEKQYNVQDPAQTGTGYNSPINNSKCIQKTSETQQAVQTHIDRQELATQQSSKE